MEQRIKLKNCQGSINTIEGIHKILIPAAPNHTTWRLFHSTGLSNYFRNLFQKRVR